MISLLDVYIARRMFWSFLLVFAVLFGIAEIFDVLEFLRRGASRPDMNISNAIKMALFKSPYLINQITPFVILFGSLHAFLSLTRNNEIIAMRAAGVSPWSLLKAPVCIVFIIAVFQVTVISHIASPMRQTVNQMETDIFGTQQQHLAVLSTGLWMREGNAHRQTILHARLGNASGTELSQVMIIDTTPQDFFIRRIDALRAKLNNKVWTLYNAYVSDKAKGTVYHDTFSIPTTITPEQLKNNFADVDNISFWQLPSTITAMEQAGFKPREHILRYHTFLAKPFMLIAMVLIAMAFTTGLNTRSNKKRVVALCVFTGFMVFFLTILLQTVGQMGELNPIVAAWIPPLSYILLSVSAIIHREDN